MSMGSVCPAVPWPTGACRRAPLSVYEVVSFRPYPVLLAWAWGGGSSAWEKTAVHVTHDGLSGSGSQHTLLRVVASPPYSALYPSPATPFFVCFLEPQFTP